MGKKQSYNAQVLGWSFLICFCISLLGQPSFADHEKKEAQVGTDSDFSAPQMPSLDLNPTQDMKPLNSERVAGQEDEKKKIQSELKSLKSQETVPTVDLGFESERQETKSEGLKKEEERKEEVKKERQKKIASPQSGQEKVEGQSAGGEHGDGPPGVEIPIRGHQDQEKVLENPKSEEVNPVPTCGMIADLLGDVQVLDQNRSKLLKLGKNDLIPCGSWISSHSGWVSLKHKSGAKIHMGQETYLQVREGVESEEGNDHLSLLRGEIFADVGGGNPEVRIASSSGRVRAQSAKVIFLVGYMEDRTQLMVLESSATLENRFEPQKSIKVSAGENSELILKNDRVIPQIPTAVALSSLEPKFLTLRIPQSVQTAASQEVMSRQKRKMAIQLVDLSSEHKQKESEKKGEGRALASARSMNSYLRNPPSSHDSLLKDHFIKAVVGGDQSGRQILFPHQYQGRTQSVGIQVEEKKYRIQGTHAEREEKKRLIEELGRIKLE